jgi:hypothetical protein
MKIVDKEQMKLFITTLVKMVPALKIKKNLQTLNCK